VLNALVQGDGKIWPHETRDIVLSWCKVHFDMSNRRECGGQTDRWTDIITANDVLHNVQPKNYMWA